MRTIIQGILLFIIITYALNFDVLAKDVNEVRLEKVPLSDFIKFISKATNQNISYTPESLPSNTTITIYSPLTLNKKELLKIFYSVLNANGLVTVKKENTLFIIKKRALRDVGPVYKKQLTGGLDGVITTVLRLNNIDVTKLRVPLIHLISSFGKVDFIQGLNAVVVTDTKQRVVQIERLLKDLDKRPRFVLKLIPIEGASAQIVAMELNKFFSSLAKETRLYYRPIISSETTGNSVLVAAKEEDFRQIQQIIERIISKKQSAQKVFYLKNATAKDVYDVITKLLAKSPGFKKTSISYDESTNSIIVFGAPDVFDRINTIIKKLDIPRKQVYIEALIIETSLSKLSEFGIEWSGAVKSNGGIGTTGMTTTGSLVNMQNAILNNNQMTALPGGFTLGVLGNIITYQGVKFPTLSALLNALKTQQGINILSNPHLVTLDNQKAEIFVGENRPYLITQKYDVNGNPIFSYDYKDVGVKLHILPHISDNKIIMEVSLEVKKIMDTLNVGQSVAPVTLTRSTSTKIFLKDGDKILISGLIKNDKGYSEKRVPLLSSIPILGNLFKYKKTTSDKTNLVIFLTTKIVANQKEINRFQKKNGSN